MGAMAVVRQVCEQWETPAFIVRNLRYESVQLWIRCDKEMLGRG